MFRTRTKHYKRYDTLRYGAYVLIFLAFRVLNAFRQSDLMRNPIVEPETCILLAFNSLIRVRLAAVYSARSTGQIVWWTRTFRLVKNRIITCNRCTLSGDENVSSVNTYALWLVKITRGETRQCLYETINSKLIHKIHNAFLFFCISK